MEYKLIELSFKFLLCNHRMSYLLFIWRQNKINYFCWPIFNGLFLKSYASRCCLINIVLALDGHLGSLVKAVHPKRSHRLFLLEISTCFLDICSCFDQQGKMLDCTNLLIQVKALL